MSAIHFQITKSSSHLPFDKQVYIDWIADVIVSENHKLTDLSFVFTSDNALLEINKEYLNHDTYTDIITFDYSKGPKEIVGEIIISLDRVTENARKFNVEFLHELSRVMIHGVLHLMGYEDKTSNQKAIMRKKEDACISLLRI